MGIALNLPRKIILMKLLIIKPKKRCHEYGNY
jgi:hypothetical protein